MSNIKCPAASGRKVSRNLLTVSRLSIPLRCTTTASLPSTGCFFNSSVAGGIDDKVYLIGVLRCQDSPFFLKSRLGCFPLFTDSCSYPYLTFNRKMSYMFST